MKKFFQLFLLFIISLSIVGCSSNDDYEGDNNQTNDNKYRVTTSNCGEFFECYINNTMHSGMVYYYKVTVDIKYDYDVFDECHFSFRVRGSYGSSEDYETVSITMKEGRKHSSTTGSLLIPVIGGNQPDSINLNCYCEKASGRVIIY